MSDSAKYNGRYFAVWMFFLGLLVVSLLACPSVLFAGQDAGNATVQSIKPVPDFNGKDIPGPPPFVSDVYDGQGPVDRIARNVIVIGDVLYKLSSPNMASGFKVGDYVGFIKNENGKIVRIEKVKNVNSDRPLKN